MILHKFNGWILEVSDPENVIGIHRAWVSDRERRIRGYGIGENQWEAVADAFRELAEVPDEELKTEDEKVAHMLAKKWAEV